MAYSSNDKSAKQRLVAVSNRLPVTLSREAGQSVLRPGSGGLVTAMAPVLRNRGGLWIGWIGSEGVFDTEEILSHASIDTGYQLHPVFLTRAEIENFYYGFSNQIIWPLFHDLQTRCNFDLNYWEAYRTVNWKFAEVISKVTNTNDFIWVHDYHLMDVARALRNIDVQRETGFFLHIPFPSTDVFMKFPWRSEILSGLLNYHLIGFQTMRDRRHFINCLQFLVGNVRVRGRGAVVEVTVGEHKVRAGAFPISIDYEAFSKGAATKPVARRARWLSKAMEPTRILLGVDRLDYTKGVPERLKGFREALRRFPELDRRITLVQVVVPSRTQVAQYQLLKVGIERLVSEINGEFSHDGWVPIHYLFRSLDREELLAHYRAADIAIVTPLKDGMNLVAKEYCACHRMGDGVLILSEFAGTASQLQRGALMVNPYDSIGIAYAINKAFNMTPEEKRRRMRAMRDNIRRQNIFTWVDAYLKAALSKKLVDFSPTREYIPTMPSDFETVDI